MLRNAAGIMRPLLFCLICFLGFAGTAILVMRGLANRMNTALIRFIQGWENPRLTPVMRFFTQWGSGYAVTILAMCILFILYRFFRHRWPELALFVIVLTGSSLLNLVLKTAFHLERPTLHRLIEVTGYSFPSGHAMGAFSLYGITAYLMWRHTADRAARLLLIGTAAFMIGAIGISRIYLGVHYPSDVIGGYFAAGCWLSACIAFYRWAHGSRR